MDFLVGTGVGMALLLLKVFCIVVPLTVILEVFREFEILDRLNILFYPLLRPLGFKRGSIYPLMAGIIFGISYGAGVLIGESRSGRIDGNQRFLVALFLGLCHAVFEDTLLFVSQGARGTVIVLSRVILATVVVSFASLVMRETGE